MGIWLWSKGWDYSVEEGTGSGISIICDKVRGGGGV